MNPFNCKHCSDTGSLSHNPWGLLDCAHCAIASERAALQAWSTENRIRAQDFDVYKIYKHGKAAAIPHGYKLVPINATPDLGNAATEHQNNEVRS